MGQGRSDLLADRAHLRTYTARELIFRRALQSRKVAFGSGEWELFEECRRPRAFRQSDRENPHARPGPDDGEAQVVRLKIPRGRRFTRCTDAARNRLRQSARDGRGAPARRRSAAPSPEPQSIQAGLALTGSIAGRASSCSKVL